MASNSAGAVLGEISGGNSSGGGLHETDVEAEGLEGEGDSVAMEVEFVGGSDMNSRAVVMDLEQMFDGSFEGKRVSQNVDEDMVGGSNSNACAVVEKSDGEKPLNDSRLVLMDEERMSNREGANSLEGKRVSHNVEGNRGVVDDPGGSSGELKVVIDDDMEGGSNSNACGVLEKSDGEKSLNDDGFGGEVQGVSSHELLPYAETTVDGKAVGVSNSVGQGDDAIGKESNAVSIDECGSKDGENSEKRGKFCVSDLVWGKVRSHPWWPGQIFEPRDASDQARKYFRTKSYLVAYFGDQTFAWNDKAKLKPFVPHFSQMVKQTGMEAFRHAVGCALDEVSRRVEFGLACPCIADDVYNEVKSQVIENAGIKEQQIVHEGAEKSFALSSFEPVELIDYISSLALGPDVEVDKLEHVMARGQISAFYRWKGYYHLPEFGSLIGYVNNEADAPITEQKEEICKAIDHQKVAEGTVEEHDSKPQKRKNTSVENSRPCKKEKCLADIIPKRGSYKERGDEKAVGKADGKSISSSSSGRKASKLSYDNSKTENSGLHSQGTTSPMASQDLKPSFRVGESILRVAGLLSKPSPLLKLDVSSHKKANKSKSSSKRPPRQTKVGPAQHSSDELLSFLQLAAMEPLKDHTMLTSMVNFFCGFRNSVVQDNDISLKHEDSGGTDIIDKSVERATESEPESVGITQRGSSPSGKFNENASDSEITTSQNILSENGQCDEKMEQGDSPTALTLKFSNLDSIPSEAKLNAIFSQFGPLRDSETLILAKKNCARVVFRRRLDAETAFSSSGKFELFGPSLVCYRLNDAPSPSPRKSSSVEPKRRRKGQ